MLDEVKAIFEAMDSNSDGFVDREELIAALKDKGLDTEGPDFEEKFK